MMYSILETKENFWGDGATGYRLVRIERGKPLINQSFWVREDELHLFDTSEQY